MFSSKASPVLPSGVLVVPSCCWRILLCCPCECSYARSFWDDHGKKYDIELEPLIDDRIDIKVINDSYHDNDVIAKVRPSENRMNNTRSTQSAYQYYIYWQPKYWVEWHKIINYERYFPIPSENERKYPNDIKHRRRRRQKLYLLIHRCFTELPFSINQHIHSFLSSDPHIDNIYSLYLRTFHSPNPMDNASDLGQLVQRSTILEQHRVYQSLTTRKRAKSLKSLNFWKWIGLNSKFSRHGITLIVRNQTVHELHVKWLNFGGMEESNALIYPSESVTIGAFVSHSFVFRAASKAVIDALESENGMHSALSVIGIYQIRHSYPTHIVTVHSVDPSDLSLKIGSPIIEIPVITKEYDRCVINGFQVFYERNLFHQQCVDSELRAILESDLCEMEHMLSDAHLELMQSVSIWLNVSQSVGHPDAVNRGYGLAFHHDPEWMKKNGVDLRKCGHIEVYSVADYMKWRECQPLVLFHEFVHFFHYHIGREREDIQRAYSMAMDRHLYDSVQHIAGKDEVTKKEIVVWRRGYAASNCYEYFAQMSEAYFGQCNYYPFHREQLKRHDEGAYRLCTKLWSLSADQIHVEHKRHWSRR